MGSWGWEVNDMEEVTVMKKVAVAAASGLSTSRRAHDAIVGEVPGICWDEVVL
jgi:hypothetical protein